jgi:hypothetical protein
VLVLLLEVVHSRCLLICVRRSVCKLCSG